MADLPAPESSGKLVKTTAVATAAVVLIILQVSVLRMVGDIVTSGLLVGLGYALGRLKK